MNSVTDHARPTAVPARRASNHFPCSEWFKNMHTPQAAV